MKERGIIMKNLVLKNGKVAILRKANKEDAQQLLIYMDTIAIESDFLTFEQGELKLTVKKQQAIIENNRMESKLFIIVVVEDKIVGNLSFSAGHRIRSRHAGEFGITVLKEYWNNSVASEMIGFMIEWAKANKVIRKINLRVRTDNPRAIHLYSKFGFKCEGILTRNFCIKEVFYDSMEMGLLLD